jgi:hypothetical protein
LLRWCRLRLFCGLRLLGLELRELGFFGVLFARFVDQTADRGDLHNLVPLVASHLSSEHLACVLP